MKSSRKSLILFAVLVALLLAGGGAAVYVASRGYRNNNPGNIRDNGTAWQGKVGVDDAGFVIFDEMQDGVRAMAMILKNYLKRGVNTLSAVISTYAPSSENDTASYIDTVSGVTGIDPGAVLSPADLYTVVPAMMRVEMGAASFLLVKSSDIDAGVKAALA